MAITRSDLQTLSRLRLREAKQLLGERLYPGAFYLAGYSIECALKACIARRTRRSEFPDLNVVKRSYSHNLAELLEVAELGSKLKAAKDPALEVNWNTVRDWNEHSRYNPRITDVAARDLIKAISAPTHGVLSWLKKYW